MLCRPLSSGLPRSLLGAALACALALATSPTLADASGILIRGNALLTTPDQSPSGTATSPRSSSRKSAPVMAPYQVVGAASLAADITSYTMTSEMAAVVNNRMLDVYGQQRWAAFQAMNGMQPDILGRDFANARDRGSLRPFLPSEEDELAIRIAMAHNFKDYAVDPGLRKLLASRESTKSIVETVQRVENAARVEVKTEAEWTFTAGGNPFTLASYVGANHPLWTFEIHTDWDNPRDYTFIGIRRLTPVLVWKNTYTQADGFYKPILGYQVNPRLGTSLGARYKLKDPDVWYSSYHEIGFSYSF